MFVEVEFGKGNLVIAMTHMMGHHGVVIAPAKTPGELGQPAWDELPLEGGFVLWFQSEDQARRVCAALKDKTLGEAWAVMTTGSDQSKFTSIWPSRELAAEAASGVHSGGLAKIDVLDTYD